jgi:thiol-disulfide isomerase/thioredoxin
LAQKKEMSLTDMKKIMGIIYEDWDKTNENLFKNSSNYRKEFDKYIMAVYQDSKYMSMLMSAKNPEDGMIVLLKAATDAVTNPYILNYFNYTYSTNIINATKDTAVATKYYQQFMANNTKQDYAKEITKIYQTKLKYSNGMPTPLFSFNNISGKPVALQSLLGKYVYIDVWATWCTPCKAEIPHLQKLEAIYKTKNIQFLSISVDEQKNAKRWKAYVTKNKLGGLQLMADSAFESNFIKSMGIISIPRFILIDPQGKLVEADALRPSDKQLKTILDKLL